MPPVHSLIGPTDELHLSGSIRARVISVEVYDAEVVVNIWTTRPRTEVEFRAIRESVGNLGSLSSETLNELADPRALSVTEPSGRLLWTSGTALGDEKGQDGLRGWAKIGRFPGSSTVPLRISWLDHQWELDVVNGRWI